MQQTSTPAKPCLILSLFTCIFSVLCAHAQILPEPLAHHHGAGHKLTLALGHAHVSKEVQGGHSEWLTMGALAFNYDYRFNDKWSLGAHNDIIFEEIPVIEGDGGVVQQKVEHALPFATRLVGTYKPGKHAAFLVGVGEELTGDKPQFLSTVGFDYEWHLNRGWEFGSELTYDIVRHAHNKWIFGIGISKTLQFGHHSTADHRF